MARALTLSAALLVAAASSPAARAAQPPAYVGTLAWPAPHPIAAPDPRAPRSPFEAAIARTVYGQLYALDDTGAPIPELAAALPEPAAGGVRIALRAGVARHDGRTLAPADALAAIERCAAAPASAFVLAELLGEGGRLEATIDADGAIVLRTALAPIDVATRLAALPCAVAPEPTPAGRSRGTGPFRAVPTPTGVELRAFRQGTPAAPYLGRITLAAPGDPSRELRDLELGRLHASWVGASLYDAPSRPMDALAFGRAGLVLAVGGAPRTLPWLAGVLDRARLRRVGLDPADSVAPGLPPPAHARTTAPRAIAIEASASDRVASAVARELAAQADARGVQAVVLEPGASREGAATLRIVTIVPPLPGPAAALGAAFVAAGQLDRARGVGLDAERAREAAPRLAAVVLGRRADVLHHLRGLEGLRLDAYGLPVLHELHIRRRSDAHRAAAERAR